MKKLLSFHVLLYLFSTLIFCQNNDTLRPKVGLVLSGGVAKGLAHIGVLKVLDEVGMPIDYIGGTSMGSIIGSLYASGYSADSIEKLVMTINWVDLFSDKVPRKYLSFDEKENDGKFFIPYPVSEGKFQMPSGLIAGQNLELLLSRLFWNNSDIQNFKQLPIPFFCVSTDIENGKAVILEEGSLARCIRSSMSMPTIFTPVNMENQILIDGGVYNNFPIDETREKGADIIIGVDAGFSPYKGKNLQSMVHIIEQSVFTHTIKENEKKKNRCNIFIKPNLSKFSVADFDKSDSIIKAGEMAARSHIEELRKLADSLKLLGKKQIHGKLIANKLITISNINVKGNNKIPTRFILSKLNIKTPSDLSIDELEEGIKMLYGTLLFQNVSYQITSNKKENILNVEITERPQSFFSLGINYNTDYNASIYFNSTFYNLLYDGTKLNVNAVLGENPLIDANYFIFSGWGPRLGKSLNNGWRFDFGFKFHTNHFHLLQYKNGQQLPEMGISILSTDIYTQTIFSNSYALGLGLQNEFISKKADINPLREPASEYKLFNLYSYLKFDTHDKSYFPSKGMKLYAEAKYISNFYDSNLIPGLFLKGNATVAKPLTKHLSFKTNVNIGLSLADSVPETYLFRAGGITTYYINNAVSFVGQRLLEYSGKNSLILGFNLQYEIFRNSFIGMQTNIGRFANKPNQLIYEKIIISGYGISYGYNSLIGPIELTFMSSRQNNFLVYLNVGFWF